MSKIFDCQQHLADLLNADAPFFNDPDATKRIVAITQRKGDIAKKVQEDLQKLGCGVIVQLPLCTFEGKEERITLGLKFGVIVTENPLLNKTGKPAEAICERILQLVHFKPNGVSVNPNARDGFFITDRNAIRMMPPTPGSMTLLNYIIAINTTVNI